MAERSFEQQLETIWVRHLPTTRRQIERVTAALRELERGGGTQSSRKSAGTDAHHLIGVAATFGRTHLAALARAAERLLSAAELSAADLVEVSGVARELDRLDSSATRRTS